MIGRAMDPTERLKRDLLSPGVELRETHISLVFLGTNEVLKVKKPVDLGFLDFTRLDARKALCEREVELNRRLAPDVYREVVPIAEDSSGRLRARAAGTPIDWAVAMRRLPDADCAQARLTAGTLGLPDVRRLAEHISRFHASARSDADTSAFGEPASIERNVQENFSQARADALRVLSGAELAHVERWQLDFLRERAELFTARARSGYARDGHGDLRLEHCYVDAEGKLSIIDCIEFNDRFRYGDVASDVAFLAMDLAWHERPDLSEALLGDYARASNDYDLYGVVDFYESYRAFVRGKISSLLEADPSVAPEARVRAAAQARKYYLLSEACTREPSHAPMLLAVGGVIASGKSTIAEGLAALAQAPVIDADRTRKYLAGVEPTTPIRDGAFDGQYSRERTDAVYAELLRRAAVVLDSKRSVVLDASFRERNKREDARALAQRFGVPFLFIECSVDRETCRARLATRAAAPSVSDGRIEVLDAFAESFEPVQELPESEHVVLDTRRPIEEAIEQLRERVA
jgi:aminoglycoside phosphotransferase family enzyme/predicted kinase